MYSDSAAANYGDPTIFDNAIPAIPAKRLGKVEEVSFQGVRKLIVNQSFFGAMAQPVYYWDSALKQECIICQIS